MNNPPPPSAPKPSADVVLEEVWNAKDQLSAKYNHDVKKLFSLARERQRQSGRPIVNLQSKSPL